MRAGNPADAPQNAKPYFIRIDMKNVAIPPLEKNAVISFEEYGALLTIFEWAKARSSECQNENVKIAFDIVSKAQDELTLKSEQISQTLRNF